MNEHTFKVIKTVPGKEKMLSKYTVIIISVTLQLLTYFCSIYTTHFILPIIYICWMFGEKIFFK